MNRCCRCYDRITRSMFGGGKKSCRSETALGSDPGSAVQPFPGARNTKQETFRLFPRRMRIRRPGDISSTLREVTLKTHFLSGTAFKRCNLITFVQLFSYVFNKNRLFFCTLNSRASKHYYNTHEVTWHFRILYIHHLISIISSFSLSFFSVVWSLLLLLLQPKSINTAKKKISLTVWSNRYFHYWSTESIKCQKERDEKDFFFPVDRRIGW